MTTRFIPSQPTLRQKKLRWMNLLAHVHDNFCDCCNPITHTIIHCLEQEPDHKFTAPERDLLKKCLTTEDATTLATTGDQEDGGFSAGDLEQLFKEEDGIEDAEG